MRFAPSSFAWLVRPVTSPPGFSKLAASFASKGSATAEATTGMPLSVSRAAIVAGVPRARNTSTPWRASSVASGAKRSARPSEERYSTR